MGQHRAERGEPSWFDSHDPAAVRSGRQPDLPLTVRWRQPSPRPRPAWSAQDFAAWSVFCHPDLGGGRCGCHTPACTVRAHLDLIDWGPAGPPLPASTR